MAATASQASMRKATSVTIGETLLTESKLLRITVSQATESGLAQAVAEKRFMLWQEKNRAAPESSNAYVEKNGLPLTEDFRIIRPR